MEMVMIPICYL